MDSGFGFSQPVECLPGDIVEAIEVDVSSLEIGHAIHVSDIALDSRFTLVSPESLVVASISARAEEEPETEEGAEEVAAEDGAEPELIRDSKKDDEKQEEDGGEKA